MPSWIEGLQGIREILNAAGTALIRRQSMQFTTGLDAIDDSGTTVVSADGATLVAQPGVGAALADAIRGTGLQVDAGLLRPQLRLRAHQWVERFDAGLLTSGAIGSRGWGLFGAGTPSYFRSVAVAGLAGASARMSTSAGANDSTIICTGETASRDYALPAEVKRLQLAYGDAGSLANRRIFFGLQQVFTSAPAGTAECIGFHYDSALNGNWHTLARTGSAGTPVDTGVAVASGALLTMLQTTPGTIEFYQDEVLIGTVSSGLPTMALNLGVRLETLAAASIDLDLYGIAFESHDFAGILDNDDFIDA